MRRSGILVSLSAALFLAGCVPALIGGAVGRNTAVERTREMLIATGSIGDQGARAIGILLEEDRTIAAVEPDGPAAKSGILAGDRLTRIHEKQVLTRQEAWNELFVTSQKEISLTVIRGGRAVWFRVKPRPLQPSPTPSS